MFGFCPIEIDIAPSLMSTLVLNSCQRYRYLIRSQWEIKINLRGKKRKKGKT